MVWVIFQNIVNEKAESLNIMFIRGCAWVCLLHEPLLNKTAYLKAFTKILLGEGADV